jgi:hypothetical protein
MTKKVSFLFLFILLGTLSFAQSNFTISGSVKDGKNGENLIGATVAVKELPDVGAYTNDYGFYSLTLKQGTYTITVQYLGYVTRTQTVNLSKDLNENWEIMPDGVEVEAVEISGTKDNANVVSTQMSSQKLDIQEINKLPIIFGERDVLKTMQLLPGIKSAGEGNSGFYVRGGSADQNLVLLDEAPVYNASHLLGFFSVFNSDAIKDLTVYKGGMPAEYGGRLSSVVDIKMKDGNSKNYGVSGGLGLIASRLTVEGPIVKNKGSFLVAGRRTYADVFLKFSKDTSLKKTQLYFYDLNAKANYQINAKNRIFLSGYFGRDNFNLADRFGFEWGNTTATLRWNHLINNKFFSNTSLIYSDYNYKINIAFTATQGFKVTSGIRDFNVKQDFQYFLNTKNTFKFGINSIYHTFIPGVITVSDTSSSFNSNTQERRYGWENAVYVSADHTFSEQFNINYGLRFSAFSLTGPGTFYSYDAEGTKSDSTKLNSGEILKTYAYLEPRFAANYIIDEKSSLKFSYGRNVQNMHLLSNSSIGTPVDKWIPSSNNVKPGIADQLAIGYFRNFKNNHFEFSVETYYKWLQNEIDYKNGANIQDPDIEAQLLFGVGRAYGLELFFKKRVGKFTGWVSYTLARTERKIIGLNNDKYYQAKQNRTHDISLVGIYDISKKWNVSATWVYYTGNAVTFPSGKYEVEGVTTNYYTERNGYNLPAYHRLDVAATWMIKQTDKKESSLSFSCYNAYGRKNVYTLDFDGTKVTKTYLFRWVPSVTWNFKF